MHLYSWIVLWNDRKYSILPHTITSMPHPHGVMIPYRRTVLVFSRIWQYKQRTPQSVWYTVTSQNVDKPKRRQPERRQTETSTNQNVDKPKRRQTETSTNQNVDKPKRRQTETSTSRNVDKPKRRQTKTSTSRNVDKPKRRQTKTSTSRNVDKLKRRHSLILA